MVLKRARSAVSGRFMRLKDALADKAHSIVETVKPSSGKDEPPPPPTP